MPRHMQPQKCATGCCGGQSCEAPIVTCHKNDSYYGGSFDYSVTNADFAWISESCEGVVTTHEITLSGGNASGTFSTSDGCTYCVVARKGSCESTCCDDCDTPECSLSVTRSASGDMLVNWSYRAWPIGYVGNDEIVSASVGGVSVFGDPLNDSGVLSIDPLLLSYETRVVSGVTYHDLVLTVTNSCGKVVRCVVVVPCCWLKTQLRITISGIADVNFDVSATESGAGRPIGSQHFQRQIRHRLTTSGLTAINGTILYDLSKNTSLTSVSPPGSCQVEAYPVGDYFHFVGSITIDEKVDASGVFTNFGAGVTPYIYTRYMQATADVYWGFHPAFAWGLFFDFASISLSEMLIASYGTFPYNQSGCSPDMFYPATATCADDGVFAGLFGFGFFVESVPGNLGPNFPINRQPNLVCNAGSVTRDFWAPNGNYSLPHFIAGPSGSSLMFNLELVKIPPIIFPDAVTLEYV